MFVVDSSVTIAHHTDISRTLIKALSSTEMYVAEEAAGAIAVIAANSGVNFGKAQPVVSYNACRRVSTTLAATRRDTITGDHVATMRCCC